MSNSQDLLLLTKGYLDFYFSFFLEELISIPTGVTSKTVTLIDHVFINSSQKISQCEVNELGISDHDLVYYTRTTALLNPNKRVRDMIRIYDQMHRTDKYSQLSPIIWSVWPNG